MGMAPRAPTCGKGPLVVEPELDLSAPGAPRACPADRTPCGSGAGRGADLCGDSGPPLLVAAAEVESRLALAALLSPGLLGDGSRLDSAPGRDTPGAEYEGVEEADEKPPGRMEGPSDVARPPGRAPDAALAAMPALDVGLVLPEKPVPLPAPAPPLPIPVRPGAARGCPEAVCEAEGAMMAELRRGTGPLAAVAVEAPAASLLPLRLLLPPPLRRVRPE